MGSFCLRDTQSLSVIIETDSCYYSINNGLLNTTADEQLYVYRYNSADNQSY